MKYQPVVGLEIHLELSTKSKMFCSCENNPFEAEVNVNVCPVCMGHPGTLPVINKEAVRKTIKAGLALNCKIRFESKFDRKNYFYPDLPKGYQISQYDKPFCEQGFLEVGGRKIRITRIHLEEDTGKLIHPQGADYSLIDFNRAGVPLMELVTEPDLRSAKETRKFAEELRLISRYLGISDADMEKGQLRVEANVSLQPKSQIPNPKSQINSNNQITKIQDNELGTKVEIKNLNSFRSVERAIDYEIKRQAEILARGEKIIQETRGWDEKKQITVSQRAKEEAHDYRYFPEPDLPTLNFDVKIVEEIVAEIPELPEKRRERFEREYGLDEKSIEIYVFYKNLGEYFEKTMSELRNWIKELEEKDKVKKGEYQILAKMCSNYIITELQGLLSGKSVASDKFLITPENFAEFIALIYEGKISSKIAKTLLAEMFKTGKDPSQIIEEKSLKQITNKSEIEKIIKDVISKNQKAVDDYKAGRENALQFLAGQVMAATKGTAEPEKVQKTLKNLLNS